MEVTVQHLGAVKFSAQTRGHSIISDQPGENSGADTGMTPPELLLASLGTCAGFYAAEYLRTRSVAVTGLEVRVTAEKVPHPARLGQFRITVKAPGLPSEHLAGLERAVKHCLIHITLLNAPEIETVIETVQSERGA
jgi:putative redox protein